jgi:hypothetical protein
MQALALMLNPIRDGCEAPEVYAGTEPDARQLGPSSSGGPLALEWQADQARTLEFGHVLLTSVAGHAREPKLEGRFALDVRAVLPDGDFVLQSDAIRRRLQANEPEDSAQPERPRRSRLQRFCASLHRRTKAPVTSD